LLRRLEAQGLLVSEWREEDKRNKRFYRLSAAGKGVLKELLAEWQNINTAVTRIVGGSRSVRDFSRRQQPPVFHPRLLASH